MNERRSDGFFISSFTVLSFEVEVRLESSQGLFEKRRLSPTWL
jgi:hypothetical protein